MHRAPDAISNAIGYAKFYSRSHDAVIRVYDEGGNVIDTHERASPYLSAVFGPDGTMSFWKRESLRRGSDQYIFRGTTKSRGCAMVTKPSGTEYGDMKIRRLDRRRASGAAASVARHELEALDFAMSSSTTTVLKTLAKHVAAHLGERAFCVVFEDDLERCWPVQDSNEPYGRRKFNLSPDLRVGVP